MKANVFEKQDSSGTQSFDGPGRLVTNTVAGKGNLLTKNLAQPFCDGA